MNKGHLMAPIELAQDLKDKIDISLKDVAIPLLLDNWTLEEESGLYKQNVAIKLDEKSNPIIMLSSVGIEPTDAELDAFGCLEDAIEITDDHIIFVAKEKPAISFTVIAKNLMTSEETAIADITTLVGKVNELETEIDVINNKLIKKKRIIGTTTASGAILSGIDKTKYDIVSATLSDPLNVFAFPRSDDYLMCISVVNTSLIPYGNSPVVIDVLYAEK